MRFKMLTSAVMLLVVGSSVASAQVGQWNQRHVVQLEENALGGMGRKVSISNGKIAVGTGQSPFVLIVDSCTGMTENRIDDPYLDSTTNPTLMTPLVDRESFGYSVSMVPDNDGFLLLVGDTGQNELANMTYSTWFASAGASHLYSISATGSVVKLLDFESPTPVAEDISFLHTPSGMTFVADIGSQFGHDVAIEGDWCAMGAPFYADSNFEYPFGFSGKAFLFNVDGSTIELLDPCDTTECNNAGNLFGTYVAISNGLVAVSDQGDGLGLIGGGAGKVHIFDTTDTTVACGAGHQCLTEKYTIARDPDNESAQQFGWDTDMHEDLLIIGHTRGASLYQVSASGSSHIFTIPHPNAANYDTFGRLVAIDENRIVIAQQGIEQELMGQQVVHVPGKVFIYQYNATAGTYSLEDEIADPTVSVSFPTIDGSENFPTGLDIEGDVLAVGSARQDTYAGETFIYQFNSVLGDVNRDGVADILDVAPFTDILSNGEYQFEADINGDCVVDPLDVAPFVDLIT